VLVPPSRLSTTDPSASVAAHGSTHCEPVIVCAICGEAFDERVYQVRAPGLPGSFDSVDCATRAVAAAARSARLATATAGADSFSEALGRGYGPLPRFSPRREL
jgi:hypothetical protein